MAAGRVPFGDNVGVSSLETQIDELIQQPLSEFTRARHALVKTVRGADATRVRTLTKPTVVAWAINQVYWEARATYERLMKAGERLRNAQIAALTGKSADLRDANDAHRKALADAVREAERLGAAAGSHPAPDALMRTLEALSLAKEPPAPPGRLTGALQPAGFEALAGVTPRIERRVRLQADHQRQATRKRHADQKQSEADRRKRAAEEKRRAAEARKRAAEIKRAEAALERAKAKMRAAEEALRRTQGRS